MLIYAVGEAHTSHQKQFYGHICVNWGVSQVDKIKPFVFCTEVKANRSLWKNDNAS